MKRLIPSCLQNMLFFFQFIFFWGEGAGKICFFLIYIFWGRGLSKSVFFFLNLYFFWGGRGGCLAAAAPFGSAHESFLHPYLGRTTSLLPVRMYSCTHLGFRVSFYRNVVPI